ncbi:aminodeoxychorismate lyase [Vibrio sp. RC27]
MVWIDGEIQEQISVFDRSFQYGDGCFTTMAVRSGCIEHWPYHRQRLEQSLDALGIPFSHWSNVEKWLDEVLSSCVGVRSGIKIHISRGTGGRGYSVLGLGSPTVTINTFPYPQHYDQWQQKGITLGLCEQRLGLNPRLAGFKHNNRLEQILLKQELEANGFVDGVVLDLNDHVIETTIANLFWFKQDVLCTPDLHQAGVAGVMRRVVIEHAKAMGTTVEVSCYKLSDLMSADSIFMTNSLLGMAPIKAIGDVPMASNELTSELQKRVLSV